MGLAHRIIPTILCRGRQLVKGRGFDSWRSVGLVAQAVRIHQSRGVDELVLLDIAATREGRGPDLSLIEELSNECFMPLAVGGGIRTVEQVRDLLRAGADQVVIGTAAFEDHGLVRRCAEIVGSQAITVSIDYRGTQVRLRCGSRPTALDPVTSAYRMVAEGAGEILLQSIERDGTCQGYDLEMIRAVRDAIPRTPLIASGGAGNYQHMLEAIQAGASAVASGAMFQFEDATPLGAAHYLASNGVEVRLP